ncbi:uncharacterized protein LOC123290606 [Chrysoperla carnea]|uniref:uncharacterized protein LOC123290606 n=1 Tax=Chrysoperla carnea TaxID=189513 RepID=UPI001D086EA8|nr:uncharacterized protein LOC123290606 [Chrysoperla carnea]
MQKGCWKVNEDDEAIYIDIDLADEESIDVEEKDDDYYSHWSELPDLLLERIFSQLNIRERYYASLVCRSWFRAFHLPGVWSNFSLTDQTLTRGRFNYYSGWQYVLDHLRTSVCLTKIGRHIRNLKFDPMLNFYNLYEFMNMVSWFTEQAQALEEPRGQFEGVGINIKSLKFIFPCNMLAGNETERIRLFGTGGKLLEALKRLMCNLINMRRLELVNLLLDRIEAQHLLDEVCAKSCSQLRTLVLINTTKIFCPLLHVGVFLNLQTLIISPQNIDDDVIELLGYTRLRNLHLVQNRYTPSDSSTMRPVSARVWRQCRMNNRRLAVHLEVEALREKELLWQEGAPVHSIIFESPLIRLQPEVIIMAAQHYKDTLRKFGHKTLPHYYQPKKFHERNDSLLLLMCRQCFLLNTLIVRERVSTATVLLLAFNAKNLIHFYIRRNAVILRADWPQSPEWTSEFYKWLCTSSRSFDAVEREVSQILGYRWKMLTDKEFKNITDINVHSNGTML